MSKKTNIEMLKEMGKLKDLRMRLGADNIDDTSADDDINALAPLELVEEYSAWKIGCRDWATDFIGMYLKLTKDN